MYFKQSSPYKKITFSNLKIENSTFIDSSLLNLQNINMLKLIDVFMTKLLIKSSGK